jgi:flagellar basal body-associated protein FliL
LADLKTPVNPPPKVEVPDPDAMSLEDLDKVISEADPDALKNIEGVREIAAEIGKPLEVLEDQAIDDEKIKHSRGFKGKLKLKAILFWVWLKNSLLEGIKHFGAWALRKKEQGQEGAKKFNELPGASKGIALGGIAILVVAIIFSYFAFVKKSLYYKQELFMTSFDEMAQQKWDTAEDTSRDTFYNSSRIPKNIFKLKKIVVNIQRSQGSGSNPMVALELSLEAGSSEVLLEIKDREGEILDQVQRTTESYTFDDLNDPEGKRELTEKIRSVINRVLTLGKIRRVYIQGIILKP